MWYFANNLFLLFGNIKPLSDKIAKGLVWRFLHTKLSQRLLNPPEGLENVKVPTLERPG